MFKFKFKKKVTTYKIPYTYQAFSIFKNVLLRKTPAHARDILKVLFQEKNNGVINPKWALQISKDMEIGVHTLILDTDESIVKTLFVLIDKH